MTDLNILNRANFEDVVFEIILKVPSGQTTNSQKSLQPGQIFCLQEIAWRYGVEDNCRDNYGWPRAGVRVGFQNVFKDRVESPFRASPPKLLQSVELSALNPSGIDIKLYFTLKGILVSPRGEDPLSLKEILGYILLNDNQKGILALSEVLSSKRELSMETILTSMAGGNLASLSMEKNQQLPAPQQAPKALASLPDDESLVSLMIGDLVTFQSSQSESLKLDLIRELAKYLVATKRWCR